MTRAGMPCKGIHLAVRSVASPGPRGDWLRLRAQGVVAKEDEEFAIVFAAMGVNMETAHFFKQVSLAVPPAQLVCASPTFTLSAPDARPSLVARVLTGFLARRTLRRTAPWTRRCCL